MSDEMVEPFGPGITLQRNQIPDYRETEGLGECIITWQWWEKKNVLPYAGGWREQPADVIQLLNLFDGVYTQYTKRKDESAQRQADAKRRLGKR